MIFSSARFTLSLYSSLLAVSRSGTSKGSLRIANKSSLCLLKAYTSSVARRIQAYVSLLSLCCSVTSLPLTTTDLTAFESSPILEVAGSMLDSWISPGFLSLVFQSNASCHAACSSSLSRSFSHSTAAAKSFERASLKRFLS